MDCTRQAKGSAEDRRKVQKEMAHPCMWEQSTSASTRTQKSIYTGVSAGSGCEPGR